MAEVTGLRNNALPYPVYGLAYGITFPLLDADGDPVSPSSPDSERSLNGDTFADCTNEATEIATNSGICYLLLTAAEMTADVVTVRVQSTGAKTTVITLYPRKLPILATGTCQGSNDTSDIQLASNESSVNDYYNGCLCVAVIDSTTEARIINDYVGSTKVAEISPAWNTAAPDSNDTYTIYLPEGRQVQQISGTATADVASFLGTAITEGAAGRFAAAISAMFNDAGAAGSTNWLNFWRGAIAHAGTAQAGAATPSITLAAGASSVTDYYKRMAVVITSGTGAGQAPNRITDYNGTSKVAIVANAWATTPDNTSVYVLIGLIE